MSSICCAASPRRSGSFADTYSFFLKRLFSEALFTQIALSTCRSAAPVPGALPIRRHRPPLRHHRAEAGAGEEPASVPRSCNSVPLKLTLRLGLSALALWVPVASFCLKRLVTPVRRRVPVRRDACCQAAECAAAASYQACPHHAGTFDRRSCRMQGRVRSGAGGSQRQRVI